MSHKADVAERVGVTDPELPSVKLGSAVLNRLHIQERDRLDRAGVCAQLGQAAACAYFLRIAHMDADVSPEVISHLKGEPLPSGVEVVDDIVATVVRLHERTRTGLEDLLTMLVAHERQSLEAARLDGKGGPARARWMKDRLEVIYAAALALEAPQRPLVESPFKERVVVTEAKPPTKAAKLAPAKVAKAAAPAKAAKAPAKKQTSAKKSAAPPAKKAVAATKATAAKPAPAKRTVAKAAKTSPAPQPPERITEFVPLPEQYTRLTESEVVDALVLLTLSNPGQRVAVSTHLRASRPYDLDILLLSGGLRQLATYFTAYNLAMTDELRQEGGFTKAWQVAGNLLGLWGSAQPIAAVATALAPGNEAAVRNAFAVAGRRVLHWWLSQDQANEARIFGLLEAAAKRRAEGTG